MVRLSGRLDPARAKRVRAFHAPKVTEVNADDLDVFALFLPLVWDTCQLRHAGQRRMRQAMFRTLFLVPSPGYEGTQCCPKEGCFVDRGRPNSTAVLLTEERPYGLLRLRVELRLRLPVCPHQSLCHSSIGGGFGKSG